MRWYKNGQKKHEAHWKDGKRVGIKTTWYESGHKMCEVYYKDGKDTASKWWGKNKNLKPKPRCELL